MSVDVGVVPQCPGQELVGDMTTTPPLKETAEQGKVNECKDSVFTELLKARSAELSSNTSRFQHAQSVIPTRPEHYFTTNLLPKPTSNCARKRSINSDSIDAGPRALFRFL